jgi:hypothetical protein
MALVEASYLSAAEFRSIGLSEVARPTQLAGQQRATAIRRCFNEIEELAQLTEIAAPKKSQSFFRRLFAKPGTSPKTRPSDENLSNFTPRAQQMLALARKEADRFNHNFVGTEHLLLGLIRLGQGVAANVLQKMGLDLEIVRKEVEKQIRSGPDQKMIGNIPYTPRVKKVLVLAAREATALKHMYVGTESIFLGLLREGDGVAGRVLRQLGVELDRTRQEILKELDPNFGGTDREK